MTSSEQDKDNSSPEDRVEKIKKEEKEDPTAYYSQGDSKESFNEEVEFSKPVPLVDRNREEMSLLKVVAYLGFGLAALAIIFILFFIRDLDDRVGGVNSAVTSLEEKMAPIKKEVKDTLDKVNADITGLKAKIDDSESRLAVMELKRALVAIKDMEVSNNPEVKAKSTQLITSIESLIGEFDASKFDSPPAVEQAPAGKVMVEEAPVIELPVVEPMAEEHAPTVEENLVEPNTGPTLETEPTSVTEETLEETESNEDGEEEGGESESESEDEEDEGGESESEDEEEEGGESEDEEDEAGKSEDE